MKKVIILTTLILFSLVFFNACVDDDYAGEQFLQLRKFIPPSESCGYDPSTSAVAYEGNLDLLIADSYKIAAVAANNLPTGLTKVTNNAEKGIDGYESGETNTIIIDSASLSYEVPPVSGFDAAAWADRKITLKTTITPGDKVSFGGRWLISREQYIDLLKLLKVDFPNKYSDQVAWNDYPIKISMKLNSINLEGILLSSIP